MMIFATIIGVLFEIYIAHMFFVKFGDIKVDRTKYILFSTAVCALLILTSLIFVKTSLMLLSFSVCYFLFSLMFEIGWLKRIILTVSLIATVALSEMIIVMATTAGMNISVDTIQNNGILFLTDIILAKFLVFAFLKPIKPFDRSNKTRSPLWLNVGTAVLPFTSVFIIVLLYRYSLIVNIKGYQLCTLIAAAALVLSNLLVLYVIKKQETYYIIQERLAFAETQIKNQLAHYSELYIQQEELKKFRHNIKNYYISLISALETMPPEEAVAYLKEKTNMEIFKEKTVNSGHPVIDAIIQTKSAVAKRKNINIESTIKLTKTIYIDELELGVLIGSALDNAIEAVSASEELRNKTIVLRIISSGEMLSIEMSNPTKENVDIQNIKTTKKDSANHGYGLNSIKSIADKYNGNLTLSCKDNYFTLSCLLVNTNDCFTKSGQRN